MSAAVALKTLEIYARDKIFEKAWKNIPQFQARLNKLGEHPLVGEARGIGLVGGLELVADKKTKKAFDPNAGRRRNLRADLRGGGADLARGAGRNHLAVCPPLIVTPAQIDELFDKLGRALDRTLDWATGARSCWARDAGRVTTAGGRAGRSARRSFTTCLGLLRTGFGRRGLETSAEFEDGISGTHAVAVLPGMNRTVHASCLASCPHEADRPPRAHVPRTGPRRPSSFRPRRPPLLTRRRFLAHGAAGLRPGRPRAFPATASGVEPLSLVVTRYKLTPPGWPSGLRLTIAVLADLHAGGPNMALGTHPARSSRSPTC